MSDQPQVVLEEIELIPHPMDAWRAALNALIACAPGDGPAIAAHLAEARQQALVFVDRTPASAGTAQLIDRLMLISAGRIVGDQLQGKANIGRNEHGFKRQAQLIGVDFAGRQPAAQPALASSAARVAPSEPLASSSTASSAQAVQGQAPASPAAQPGKASNEPAPGSAPQSEATESRPLGDSPCL